MKISSIRLGHANNSSSTHSILLHSSWDGRDTSAGKYQFGWEWFHLRTKKEKTNYLAAMIASVLSQEMSEEHAHIIAHSLTGCDKDFLKNEGSYVDHQSVFVFPRTFGSNDIDNKFLKEFVTYVRDNPNVTIRGGNDNEVSPPSIDGTQLSINDIPKDSNSKYTPLVCRKDKNWWTLYNKKTGAKVRMSFSETPGEFIRASTPELVDVKITSQCGFGCHFCYMSSKPQDQHGDLQYIKSLAYQLKEASVFEVALGGGEPTAHPDFIDIIQHFAYCGITPNFTTFNMSWTKDPEKVECVKKHCGSFAVSDIKNTDTIKAIEKWNDENPDLEATLQIPLGCYDEYYIKNAIEQAHTRRIPITLLGFKIFGRGEKVQKKDYSWIIDYLEKSKIYQFGADTLFVEEFSSQLDKISKKLIVGKEGQFSCYIDAVDKKMGPSSYTDQLHSINDKNVFEKFPYA